MKNKINKVKISSTSINGGDSARSGGNPSSSTGSSVSTSTSLKQGLKQKPEHLEKFKIIQDGTSSRTVTWFSKYKCNQSSI